MWAAGWEFSRPAQKYLLSRVEPRPETKGPFVPGGGCTRDKRPPFCPGSWLHPGQKPPYITLLLPRPLIPQHFAIFLISAGAPSSRCSIRRLLLAIVVVPERRRPLPPED